MFITTYFILIDADNEDGQSFWSCLQDIQEGMQVKYKYLQISYTNLHLGAFFGTPPERDSITEDFYINLAVHPMMCE